MPEPLSKEQVETTLRLYEQGKLILLHKPPYDCPDCSAKIVTLEWQPDKDCFKMMCPVCKAALYA